MKSNLKIWISCCLFAILVSCGEEDGDDSANNQQNPNIEWVNLIEFTVSRGGAEGEEFIDIKADILGNIYVLGHLYDSGIEFASTDAITKAYFGEAKYASYLAKYNSKGEILWLTGVSTSNFNALRIDKIELEGDKVYLIGKSGLVMAYSKDGIFENSYTSGVGNYANLITGLSVASDGNIFLFGQTSDFANSNPFLAKLDANLNEQWLIEMETPENLNIHSDMTIDSQGDIIFGGSAIDSIVTKNLNGDTETYMLDQASYIVKYTTAGNLIWLKSIPGEVRQIETDDADNIYISGAANGGGDLDPGPGVEKMKNINSGHVEGYVLSLNASGDFRWAQAFSAVPNDYKNLTLLSDGSVWYQSVNVGGVNSAIQDKDFGVDIILGGGTYIGARNYILNLDPNTGELINHYTQAEGENVTLLPFHRSTITEAREVVGVGSLGITERPTSFAIDPGGIYKITPPDLIVGHSAGAIFKQKL